MYNKLFTKVNEIGQGLDHNDMSYDFLSVPNHLLFRAISKTRGYFEMIAYKYFQMKINKLFKKQLGPIL